MKREIHAATLWTSDFCKTDNQLCEKEQIFGWVLTASKDYSGGNYLIKMIWNEKITRQFETS